MEMTMEIVQSERGWDVVDNNGAVLASFPTNAQAWRYVDRQSGEAISRSEDVAAWIMGNAGTDNRQGTLPDLKRPSVRDRLRRMMTARATRPSQLSRFGADFARSDMVLIDPGQGKNIACRGMIFPRGIMRDSNVC
jgi:hypothetical protein